MFTAFLAFFLVFSRFVTCSLPNDFKQNFLVDLKSILNPDELHKMEVLPRDQFETVIKLIYSERLTVGTGFNSKLRLCVYNYGEILEKRLQSAIGEPQSTELKKILKKLQQVFYFSRVRTEFFQKIPPRSGLGRVQGHGVHI